MVGNSEKSRPQHSREHDQIVDGKNLGARDIKHYQSEKKTGETKHNIVGLD